MKRALKKGFTIVELAIVIAVIAILVAVIIPTVTTIVGNAKVSADTTMVKNLNTALAVEEAKDGKNATMTDVLDDVAEYGYNVTKLFPSSAGNDIVWDSKNDRFALVKTEGNEVVYSDASYVTNAPAKVDCWKIAETYSAEEGYSVYLKDGYAGESALTVSTGIDVGNNDNITSIIYDRSSATSAQEVTIRTNGGTLTVNAPLDTVNHYSMINVVNISDIALTDCYHEYGTVKGTLNLTKGKIILESGSNTGFVNVNVDDIDGISIDIKTNANYGYVTAINENLLNAVKEKISSVDEVKALVAEEETVAIVNGVAYNTLEAAQAAFTENNAVFELFCDIINNDMDHKKSVNIPANGTFDGHGYQFNGNVAIYVNAAGGTVKNVAFYMIANNAAVDEVTKEYYQMEKTRGQLTAIYASGLTGKVVIESCIFDSVDWDAIQITPKAGSEIDIHNNIFRTSNTIVNQQMRFIHIESTQNTDFALSVKNCDFYDLSKLNQTGIEIYYPKDASKVIFAENYYDGLDTSKTYTNDDCKQYGTLFDGHLACVGTGGVSYINACIEVLNDVASQPNN